MSSDIPDDLVLLDLARGYLETHEEVRRGVEAIGLVMTHSPTGLATGSGPAPGTRNRSRRKTPHNNYPRAGRLRTGRSGRLSASALDICPCLLVASPPQRAKYGPNDSSAARLIAARCR